MPSAAKVRWPLLARRLHKWLALVVGIQVVVWTLTGFYMVVVHLDRIHGDHLVRPVERPEFNLESLVSPAELLAEAPGATEIRTAVLLDRPVWQAIGPDQVRLFDARTGAPLPPVTEPQVRQIAEAIYTGDDPIASIRLLRTAPLEMQTRPPPYWQVTFERWDNPTLYISPQSGELISRRHALWRIFDFVWMLHIMDYDERSDVNNPLLRVSTWLAAFMALTGAWLLVWSFPRKRKKKPMHQRTPVEAA